jgi:ABC transporter substrate binding protein
MPRRNQRLRLRWLAKRKCFYRRCVVYGDLCRYPPEAGAVCGKAVRTDLGGGRAMKRTSLPLRRRDFITLLGGAAAAWPLAARAQQGERVRRIGVLMHLPENDPEAQARMRAFLQGLQQLGWTEGRNLQIDYRFGAADVDRARRYAAELIALAPDVIQASGTGPMAAVQQATRKVPIVFAQVPDPVNASFVDSLARPGGNATGFSVRGIRHQRKMAGAAQGGRAPGDAGGCASGSHHRRRNRSNGRHPIRGALAPRASEPRRRARRQRDRACHRGFRSWGKWRADRAWGPLWPSYSAT